MMRNKLFTNTERNEIVLIVLILTIMILFCVTSSRAGDPSKTMVDSVKAEIKAQGILHPEIVLRQSIWESGWYKCTECSWRYKNPFGFRYPTWVTPDNPKGYIKFDYWQDAVAYYKRWQDRHYKGGDYYQFLIDRHYASDSEKYVKHLKSLKI